jgi:hypothetical protein
LAAYIEESRKPANNIQIEIKESMLPLHLLAKQKEMERQILG